jgi:Fe2+ or Zn2+ uptake regulation protein
MKDKDYARGVFAEQLRRAVLELLAAQADRRANDEVLFIGLVRSDFPSLTRDRVRTELAWLAEQGLIAIETLDRFQLAELTERGHEAATGSATIPGVWRPLRR